MGITNMAATIPGFLVPALVGALTHGVVSFFFVKKPSTFGNMNLKIIFSILILAWFRSLAYNILLDCWTSGSRISHFYTVCIWRSATLEYSRIQ